MRNTWYGNHVTKFQVAFLDNHTYLESQKLSTDTFDINRVAADLENLLLAWKSMEITWNLLKLREIAYLFVFFSSIAMTFQNQTTIW